MLHPLRWLSRVCLVSLLALSSFARAAAAQASAAQTDLALPVLATPATMNGTIDDSWASGAHLTLSEDFTNRRPSSEATSVVIARDGDSIDIAFDARQREPQIATQHTNSSAVTSDDYVGVYFWPQGSHGFTYGFASNPRGARYQGSSENSAYAPQWTAVAKSDADGYTVTMRIPLRLIRSGGSNVWRVQFVRQVVATNSVDVWKYSPAATSVTDPVAAGTISNFLVTSASSRPKPRAQIYALGEATNAANGGSTSRLGADFSLPVTPTSSLVASIHPDFSNVEVDQQTISPTPFAYQYSEVRPFFTQVGQSFDHLFSCTNCPTLLYTPSIPTFRDAYAYEGTQGPLSFGAFDAVGVGRDDAAEALNYSEQTSRYADQFSVQHESVDATGGINDDTTIFTGGYQNRNTHAFVYANGAIDRGSLITSPGDANYLEVGAGAATSTQTYGITYQQVGAQFSPLDGFVAQNDITGYEGFYNKTFNFGEQDVLHDISVNAFGAEYRNRYALRAQEDASEQINFDLRDLATVHVYSGESAVRIEQGQFLPYDGNGALIGYKFQTATPSYVQYTGGPYYHGKLNAWSYVTTLPVAPRVHLRLESDEDQYLTHALAEAGSSYWLDRASLDWQLSRDASFDVGARRLVGTPLPGAFGFSPGLPAGAGNITAAFHLLQQKNEFYFVYGDPNSLTTKPALYFKWIRYIGAPKGT